ncbi:MAG: WhiB family transcriptional regulator [Nitrospira sp.]|nr:WhiB family transcriptional regulator [Nitrospira sp.]
MGFGLEKNVPCLGKTEFFYLEEGKKNRKYASRQAKRICSTCHWRFSCYEQGNFASSHFSMLRDTGVWGGLTESDRTHYRKRQIPITPELISQLLLEQFGQVVDDYSLLGIETHEQSHHLCGPSESYACGDQDHGNQPNDNPAPSVLVDLGAFVVYEVYSGSESYLLPLLRVDVATSSLCQDDHLSQAELDNLRQPTIDQKLEALWSQQVA